MTRLAARTRCPLQAASPALAGAPARSLKGMAWLKQGQAPAGLPPFAPRPPPTVPPLLSSGRAGSLSSEGALPSHYSTDTQPSTLEEEELSRELTMELLEDFALEEQSRRGSAHPSRKPSEGRLPGGEGAADGDAAAAAAGRQDWEEEAQPDDAQAASPEPSLYDQLGGGVVVKVGWGQALEFSACVITGCRARKPAS